jgi:hypothetical protein
VHISNPSYLEGRDRRIEVQGQTVEKLARPYLKNKMGVVAYTYDPSYSGYRGRRISVQS